MEPLLGQQTLMTLLGQVLEMVPRQEAWGTVLGLVWGTVQGLAWGTVLGLAWGTVPGRGVWGTVPGQGV